MKKSADEIKAAVDAILAENNSELDVMEKSILDNMDSKQQETEAYISSLQEVIQIYESGAPTNTATEIFTLNKAIASLKIPERSEPVLPEFRKGNIEKQEIKRQLGRLSQRDPKIQIEEKQILQASEPSVSKTKLGPNMKLASFLTIIGEVRFPNLSDVHHLSPLPSGELWASDMNGNLILCDLLGNRLYRLPTGVSSPTGYHTVNTQGELLYTSHKDKTIYRVAKNMAVTTLTTTGDWTPRAIYSSHINGDLLVGMTRNKQWKVTRYSKDGEKLQDIQRDHKGQALYRSILYLTENINGDICVSDSSAGQVVVVTRSGQCRFSYHGQMSMKGFSPNGICTDVLGHIIVCNTYNFALKMASNVHLLIGNGQFLMILNIPGENQQAVCVDNQHNLWVGRLKSNLVSVYRYLRNEDKA
jgi:hypothetical protein